MMATRPRVAPASSRKKSFQLKGDLDIVSTSCCQNAVAVPGGGLKEGDLQPVRILQTGVAIAPGRKDGRMHEVRAVSDEARGTATSRSGTCSAKRM